jgi:tetratricopeptide (TPR) repeat protein
MEAAGSPPHGISLANHIQGLVALLRKDLPAADGLFRRALATADPDRTGAGGRGSILSELGRVCRDSGRLEEARDWYEQSVRENEAKRHVEGRAVSQGYLAQTLLLLGRVEEAEALFREALAVVLAVGRETTTARIRLGLADILLGKGDPDGAKEHLREVLAIYKKLGMTDDLEAVRALTARAFAPPVKG